MSIDHMKSYWNRVDRLSSKIKQSKTPVPGFIVGLSGTDSIVAFSMLYDAMSEANMQDRLLGVHYVKPFPRTPGAFEADAIPWMKNMFKDAKIAVQTPLGGYNLDQMRWADLHIQALADPNSQYWVSGTINATEYELGKYSMLATAVSLQPLITMYKSTVMSICTTIGVPQKIMGNARLPDCLCGREEIAAENIELIDQILTSTVDVSKHDPHLLNQLFEYIAETKRQNSFKKNVPYEL